MTCITLFSTLAVRAALENVVLPTFGQDVAVTFDPTMALASRIAKGEFFDVIIGTEEFLSELVTIDAIDAPIPLASSGIGLAVLSGMTLPAINSVSALKRTLLNARSVAYSRTGASGIYFAGLIERLGIAAAVNARATILPKGLTGDALVDGRADIAVQQTSELLSVRGVILLGELPSEVQQRTRFSAALAMSSKQPERAATFLRHLISPSAMAAYQSHGLTVSVCGGGQGTGPWS